MALGDIHQVRVFTRFGAQLGLIVRQYRTVAETLAGVTTLEIATQMDVLYAPPMRALITSAANYTGVDVQKIRPLPPTIVAQGTANAGVGLVGGDPLPRQCSGLITLRTNFSGRRFRGRSYVPFPGEADNSVLSAPTAAYIANLTSLSPILSGNIPVVGAGGTATLSAVIWHRTTLTDDIITSVVIRSEWATQRRRGAFGRPNT